MSANLIVAAPGTGKSTFVLAHPEMNLVDTDFIAWTEIPPPLTPGWEQDADLVGKYADDIRDAVLAYAEAHPETILLTPQIPSQWPREMIAAVVSLPAGELARRSGRRHALRPNLQTADESMEADRINVSQAQELGIPVVASFEEALPLTSAMSPRPADDSLDPGVVSVWSSREPPK